MESETDMELRHFRYFVAVAEAGSFTVAAQEILHTSQPSLSRQIRDLEEAVGVSLLTRSAYGVELTPAGKIFLDHARILLVQAEAAIEATRRAASTVVPSFFMGFLTGHEPGWMTEALKLIHEEMPGLDVTILSQTSPQLASALSKGTLDVAVLRREEMTPDLAFDLLINEPLVVVLPKDHRLAASKAIRPVDLLGETFVGVSDTAPVLRSVIQGYLHRVGVKIEADYQVDHIAMAMSLIVSTRGLSLLPAYSVNFLPKSVTSRPLQQDPPTIELVLGYKKINPSPVLKWFVSKSSELVSRVLKGN
jgi:LysR family hca operon transcriptional activator